MLLPIENVPRDYAWGRRGAISALLGRDETEAVEAELWLGAHPGSPSSVVGGDTTLLELVPDLHFLLKVLATAAPLSIQAHPDAEQARAGYERENAAGIPIGAPERSYRDPFPKPELIVAVSERFEALAGFRPSAESAEEIRRIAESVDAVAEVRPLLDRLGDDATVGDALAWLLVDGPEVDAVVAAVERGLRSAPARHPYAARIAARYPGDPGVVGSLLLHHVVLRRGEALYLPPGIIHAYLDGIGIELMTASDNVLRGGLTPKHVDAVELARVLDRRAGPVPRLEPRPLPGGGVEYRPDGAGFSLAYTEDRARLPLDGPAIVLCTAGEFVVEGARSSAGIVRGEALYASPDEGELRLSGSGSLYIAR